MMPSPVRVLLLLITVLSAALASFWVDQQGHWRNLAWSQPAAKAPEIKLPAGVALATRASSVDSYPSIQARPLFAPDRRPPPPPAPPPPPDPLAEIQLFGVFSGASSGIIARVEGKMRRVKVDEALGQWTLKQIVGRTVTFVKGDEKRELKLTYAPLAAPRAAPAPAPNPNQPPAAKSKVDDAAAKLNQQDEARDRLRRRNEIRAAKGLPPVTE